MHELMCLWNQSNHLSEVIFIYYFYLLFGGTLKTYHFSPR